jgi:hypothetical protein
MLHRFGEVTAELTERFGGTVVKSTGDGHLITFDGPTQAIRCAEALRADAETLGIEIRAGIHTGECELLDADIGGLAVHIAARILGQAGPGDILVSSARAVSGSGPGPPGSWCSSSSPESKSSSVTTPPSMTARRAPPGGSGVRFSTVSKTCCWNGGGSARNAASDTPQVMRDQDRIGPGRTILYPGRSGPRNTTSARPSPLS